MEMSEFIDATLTSELTSKEGETVTRLLDLVADVLPCDEMVAGVHAARLIKVCRDLQIDPMNVVAFVETDLQDQADTGLCPSCEQPLPSDEAFAFWGIT